MPSLAFHHDAPQLPDLENILPQRCFVNTITWDFDKELENTLVYNTPGDCPANCTYVPPQLCSKLIKWAHICLALPGPYELFKEKYWQPNMHNDINKFSGSCSTSAQSKVPCHFPAGKLMPLSTPQCQWSYIVMAVITGLLLSEGNTVILVVTDRFSCSIRLIPIPAVSILFNPVFRHNEIGENTASNRELQFIYQVWHNFMEKLGVPVTSS